MSLRTADELAKSEECAVPVIDLNTPVEHVVTSLSRACLEHGFFYLVNHGLPQALIDATMEQQRKLFALPEKEKMELLADKNNRGYTPYEEQTLDPEHQTSGDTKEGFYIGEDLYLRWCSPSRPAPLKLSSCRRPINSSGREVSDDSDEASKPLHGPNQWPSEAVLPEYRPVVSEFLSGITDVSFRLLELLALSLDLPQDWFADKFDPPILALRPLHYSGRLSDTEKGVFAAGAHTDWGMLTLLLTDDQPGLQINHKGNWIDVKPRPGCFVVNLGDMLERWTNGRYKSTLHRVVNTTGQERYSVPFFLEPSFDTLVECLPNCCSEQEPAKYPPVTTGQYLLAKHSATHAGFAPDSDERVS